MGEYPRQGIGQMKKGYRRHDEEFKRELIARIDGGQITKAQAATGNTTWLSPSSTAGRGRFTTAPCATAPTPREKQLERRGGVFVGIRELHGRGGAGPGIHRSCLQQQTGPFRDRVLAARGIRGYIANWKR